MSAAVALTVPARCPRGHVLDHRTAILARSTVHCAICDRRDCYRAHHGTEPPEEVIAPERFHPVGLGITAAARATFLSEDEPATYLSEMDSTDQHHADTEERDIEHHETEQESTVSHSDPTSSLALRSVNSARRRPTHGARPTTWRDFLDPFQVPAERSSATRRKRWGWTPGSVNRRTSGGLTRAVTSGSSESQ